jgi:hypothetical protein
VSLQDTEGRRFEGQCTASACEYARVSGKPGSADKIHVGLLTSGRLVGICDLSSPSAVADAGDCRALVCKADVNCPPLHGLDAGHCLNGLCISPELPLGSSDAVLLCLAGTGLGRSAPKQVERYAMALNCGEPCRVPTPCRQP